jgi:replication-associated recombination protein RarA
MPASKTPYQIKLIDNYEFDEVASAMQKCTRRGLEYEACWWAYVLHTSGFHKYMWRRLVIIASEDVGNATPDAAVLVSSLLQNYNYAITATNRSKNDALVFAFQAIIYLCRATKTREADSLVNLIRTEYGQGKRLDSPAFSLDMHTKRGRQIHGSWQDGSQDEIDERHRKWFDEFAKVEPDAGDDRYVAKLRKLKGASDE